MHKYIRDVLNGKGKNYILPFFCQHGEEELIIREEMMRIYEFSSRVVCVESCLRPDINVPVWWRDLN